MAVVKRIKRRGATITVESHAEVLFMPGGSVHRWTNMFTGRIRSKTIAAAPSNKRPRWAHYGKPLKGTIVSARPRFWGNGRDLQRVHGAVGSTADYAIYVDQGTGVYGGSGPYPAKILPPWQHGSPSLYESTWKPGGPQGRTVPQVMIKGQRGQKFFEKGLAAAFRSMRMRSAQVPGEGPLIGGISGTETSIVGAMLGPGRQSSPAFIGQLNEWRAWRDQAWENREGLGRGRGIGSKAHQKAVRPPRPPRPPKAPTRAQIAAAYHQAIKNEREALRQQLANDPRNKGRTISVSARRKHNGAYAYQVTLTRGDGRTLTFWVTSDYQVGL